MTQKQQISDLKHNQLPHQKKKKKVIQRTITQPKHFNTLLQVIKSTIIKIS